MKTISLFGWEQLTYHSYSPDQVYFDFHLFSPIQQKLCPKISLQKEYKNLFFDEKNVLKNGNCIEK